MNYQANIEVIPIPNENTLSLLKSYNVFLKSIFMKNHKSFTTLGGCCDVVAVDSLTRIELTDEVCHMINAFLSKLPCFSLYCGLTMSQMLISLWLEPCSVFGKQNLISGLNEFQNILQASLDSLKTPQSSIDLQFLESLVISLLVQERSILLEENSLNDLSRQIVKAVLSVTDTSGDYIRFGYLGIHLAAGQDEFLAASGVLCELDDINYALAKKHLVNQQTYYTNLLFSSSLDIIDDASHIVEEIMNFKIDVIFCQRRVSDYLKLLLRRRGIVVVERCGEDLTKSIQLLTGASPIFKINELNLNHLQSLIGQFNCVKFLGDNPKNVLSFENPDKNIAYVYIRCRSFCNSLLIKKVVDNTFLIVKSMLSSPYCLPGAVEFEKSLTRALEAGKGSRITIVTEIISIFVMILRDIQMMYCTPEGKVGRVDAPTDNYALKRNALMVALEGVINILSLSYCIKKY